MSSVAQQRRGRYAPSPTGPLHLGNLRTALLCWLQMRLMDGVFVLRIEDLDAMRVVDGGAEHMMDDLRWLGLDWDEGPDVGGPFGPYIQSERLDVYENALTALHRHTYPCYCSRKDIKEASSAPHGRTTVYPGTCRDLSAAQGLVVQQQKGGRVPTQRLRVDQAQIGFDDGFYGAQHEHLAHDVGDFILKRRDGYFSYQLAVVVDDGLMQITDVLRGEDLLHSTARQIYLFEQLGYDVPNFWHVPLMCDAHGAKLSKRDGACALSELKDAGWSPERVVGRLAFSAGLVPTDAPISVQHLLTHLTLAQFETTLNQTGPTS